MCEKFRAHHIICTSLYQGEGYSSAFCNHMSTVVKRLRSNPDEELLLVAETDLICRSCPNYTKGGKCSDNNSVVGKDRCVIKWLKLKEGKTYSYREMCRHACEHLTEQIFMESCGNCDWKKQGLCRYEDLIAQLKSCVEM